MTTTAERVVELVNWVRRRRAEVSGRLKDARHGAVLQAATQYPVYTPPADWDTSFGAISSAYRDAVRHGFVAPARKERCDLIEIEYANWLDMSEYTGLLFAAEMHQHEMAMVREGNREARGGPAGGPQDVPGGDGRSASGG